MNNFEIRLIENTEIERVKWNRCVVSSSVPQIYARAEYLDLVSPDWAGLIFGDYQFVMPLNIQRKLKMKFLLQPLFAQQHGIFPDPPLDIQTSFLKYIHKNYQYVAIHLNASHIPAFPKEFEVTERKNLILNLKPGYDKIRMNYSKHALRQIKKAESAKVTVVKGLQSRDYIRLKNEAGGKAVSQSSMLTLQKLIEYGHNSGTGFIYAAYSDLNTLCAAAFFLNNGQRVIYLNAASNAEGKENQAMYSIVDAFIKEHAGYALTLDFEGSSIEGVARFYEGFGAISETYYSLKLNRLPLPFRWFKK